MFANFFLQSPQIIPFYIGRIREDKVEPPPADRFKKVSPPEDGIPYAVQFCILTGIPYCCLRYISPGHLGRGKILCNSYCYTSRACADVKYLGRGYFIPLYNSDSLLNQHLCLRSGYEHTFSDPEPQPVKFGMTC